MLSYHEPLESLRIKWCRPLCMCHILDVQCTCQY